MDDSGMTTPIDPKVIDKIKKCLALASSDNPNEAATAMRQAQALMRRHGVTSEAVMMSDIGEAESQIRTMARNNPAMWECALAVMVAESFGCKVMVLRMQPMQGHRVSAKVLNAKGRFVFVGLKAHVEMASYTTEVLTRKCQKARAEFIRTQLEGIGKVNRKLSTKAGDEFAKGWVSQITRLVKDFAGPADLKKVIDGYIANRTNSKVKPRGLEADRPEASADRRLLGVAAQAGMLAARDERLYRPVGGAMVQTMLEA